MRKYIVLVAAALVTTAANAALLGRLPLTPGGADYQAYYDTDLDITWVADADLAATNTFGLPRSASTVPPAGQVGRYGQMNWYTAQNWIGAMNAVDYLGASNWRLPTTAQPDPTCDTQFDAGGGYPIFGDGYSCTGSEMGHLRNVDGVVGGGQYQNVYWTGTTYAPQPAYAWVFYLSIGYQLQGDKNYYNYAWPVAPGDPFNAVPLPAGAWLLPSALAALGWVKRAGKTGA